jgi:hypothetical protein
MGGLHNGGMTCQVTELSGLGERLSWMDGALQLRVRILRSGKRRGIQVVHWVTRHLLGKKRGRRSLAFFSQQIGPGGLVKVRSAEDIRSMLDDRNKYKGCLFIDEMFEHYGGTYTVLKKVDMFFDEVKQKMCRCKDTVILQGVLCSGRQRIYSRKCDRNCFFFWHTDWLEAANGTGEDAGKAS